MRHQPFVIGQRERDAWRAQLSNGEEIEAKVIINAAGPWVKHVLNERLHQPSSDLVRLVRGSHVLLPKLYDGDHAFILQNDDRRVVFMIPYGDFHTLVGTTDVPQHESESAKPTFAEVDYLCRAVNRYLAKPITPHDVVWRYAGVRPLYDDGKGDPSAVTRDYTLRVDDDAGATPVLSIFGGKITTYRHLAETVLERLRPYFPELKGPWTHDAALPGSDIPIASAALAMVLAVYMPPHAPSPGQMARSMMSTSSRDIKPRAHAPTASKASMMVTSFSVPSVNLATPGMIEPL